MIALSGCHSKKTVISVTPGHSSVQVPSKVASSTGDLSDATRKLMSEADKWLGTPYCYGGHTRGKGADCSGFVTQVFSDALAIQLPRSSAQQQQWCSILRGGKTDMIPGDLVFFTTGKGTGVSHVGLYIGNGKMIHSSTSKGVIVSDLDERYYAETYHSAGRVEPYYAMIGKKTKGSGRSKPINDGEKQPSISLGSLASNQTSPTVKTTVATPTVQPQPVTKISTERQVVMATVTQQPDTALSPDEARRRLLLRLETDSIR